MVTCPKCGSDELTHQAEHPQGGLQVRCTDCGHSFVRHPRQPCPRCGSLEVDTAGYEGWAFEDNDEARGDPRAAWYYVDWQTLRCRACRHTWEVSAGTRHPQ